MYIVPGQNAAKRTRTKKAIILITKGATMDENRGAIWYNKDASEM